MINSWENESKVKKIYHDMTNVNLDEQQRIWDERGKGYFGEYLVFKKLFFEINGTVKYLMNLQIPSDNGKSTEIDLIMIHETGIYVFEIKHYKGTIYGKMKDEIWTQYFKTTKNNNFKNPVFQNEYHIKSLKNIFPNVPIFSIIVFSNDECDIKVNNTSGNVMISNLASLKSDLLIYFRNFDKVFNMKQIDNIFRKLEMYSSIKDKTLTISDNGEVTFYEYIDDIKNSIEKFMKSYKDEKEQIYIDYEKKVKELKNNQKKLNLKWLKNSVYTMIFCILITFIYCNICRLNYEKKLNIIENKFQKVNINNLNSTQLINSIIDVSNVNLNMSSVLKNTILFSCTLTNNNNKKGILLNQNTTYVIRLDDGTVLEYDMFDERLAYNEDNNRLSGTDDKVLWRHSGTLKELKIYNIENISQIKYIKLTNISLWELNINNNAPIENGLELELYSSE